MKISHKIAVRLGKIFLISFLIISLTGGFFSMKGKQVPITDYPTSQYETVSFGSEARDRLRLEGWFFPAGSEKVALVVHGWSGNRSSFLGLAQYLQTEGINVLTVDLRGGTGKNTYGQYEEGDISGAVTWLKGRQFAPENIFLIGNSLGGAASINYASSHSVGGLALISPVLNISHTKQYVVKDLNLLFPTIYATGITVVERLFYGIKPVDPEDVFGALRMPVIIFHGTEDHKASIDDVYKLQKSLSKDQEQITDFVFFENADHTFFKDNAQSQKEVSQDILDFIKKISRR
ncbi:MAG: hypothetical protein K0S20_265 [Patescibacteria group bacterium]|jgi:pimeloyl-ACP methyl ester carboxylesterase|nr:hypothetical protein [Patescibacteria group bacterium]